MSYIGNTATQQAFTPAVDFFNGNGSTTAFTLSRPVASVAQVQVVISNVPQKPGDAYTVSGNTITFTSAPPSGTQNIYVYYTSPITQVIAPGQGTVGTAQIQDSAVTTAKIANAAVTTAKLSSTTGSGAVALTSLPTFGTTIGVGGATASASGSGITFPASQSASSDANTLDDYEEGSWTPVMRGAGTAGTYTGTFVGRYTKIGNVVTVYCQANPGTAASGGTNYMQITGLPFANTYQALGSLQMAYVNMSDTAKYWAILFISGSGVTSVYITEVYDNTTTTDLSIGAFSTLSSLQFSLTYFTST